MKTVLRCMALLAVSVLLAVSPRVPAWSEETFVDYASQVRLDTRAETLRQEVTVHAFVDGDTTHFNVPKSINPEGVLKARYIAINTPESTGKIEEWGKKASAFTKEKLQSADSIIIESDTAGWNMDSTSTRDLVWVWYRPEGENQYRNLNIELLQNGLAIANSAAQNRYGETCMAAIAQARAWKLNIYSGQKDPDYFYGDAIELTIRELRLHPEEYSGKKVAFSGVVTLDHNNTVLVEDYDEETGLYFGIPAYYGFNMSGGGLEVLTPGNLVRIVGIMQYYEAGQAWQISGMNYRMMKPKDPGNIQIISQGHAPAWKKTDPESFWQSVTLDTENGPESYDFAYLALGTSVSMTAKAEMVESVSSELICLECSDCGPDSVKVYAPPLYDETGRALTAEDFSVTVNEERGVTTARLIQVHGIVDCYNGEYNIRVYTQDGITFLD